MAVSSGTAVVSPLMVAPTSPIRSDQSLSFQKRSNALRFTCAARTPCQVQLLAKQPPPFRFFPSAHARSVQPGENSERMASRHLNHLPSDPSSLV
jgi:hypothetical protein